MSIRGIFQLASALPSTKLSPNAATPQKSGRAEHQSLKSQQRRPLEILSADGFVPPWQKSARSKSNKNKVGELDAVKSENLIFKGGCDGH